MAPRRNPVTILDIAHDLGVSHSTVSRALRDSPLIGEATRLRVKKAAHSLGYVADGAARMMRGGSSALVGFVLPDVRPHFFSEMTTEFGRQLTDRGMKLMLCVSQNDPAIEEAQIHALRTARVAGVVIYPTAGLTADAVRLLDQIPTVQVARHHSALASAFVGLDDDASMGTLVRHLYLLGHRRIGFICSDPRFTPSSERLRAFRDALASLGAAADERLIKHGPPSAQGGIEAATALLAEQPSATAIMVASAPMAEGLLDLLQQRGLNVPDDVSVTSFGDPYWYRSWGPGITTVSMAISELVESALDLLLDPGTDEEGANDRGLGTMRVRSHVVLRRSTAPPAA